MKLTGKWALLASLALAATAGPAQAQSWPQRVVRIVVPFSAGSGGDVVARIYTPRLAESTGQQFIVENRAGAAGNIGAEAVARSAADGYTWLLAPASLASSQSMVKAPSFDLVKDFEPSAIMASLPFVMVINPRLPANSVKEFVALAKSRPGQLNYASSGVGGAGHLSTELFRTMADINLVHVPYKAGTDGMPDLISGQIAMMITAITVVMPHVKAGRLRALAVTGSKRSQLVPDIPTVAELGFPGYSAGTWHALLAPAGTPKPVALQLNKLVVGTGQEADIRNKLLSQGAEPENETPDQVRTFIAAEVVKWGKVIKAAGVQGE